MCINKEASGYMLKVTLRHRKMLHNRVCKHDNTVVAERPREFHHHLCDTVLTKSAQHKCKKNQTVKCEEFSFQHLSMLVLRSTKRSHSLCAVRHGAGPVTIWAATSGDSFTLMVVMCRCVTAKAFKAFSHRCIMCRWFIFAMFLSCSYY